MTIQRRYAPIRCPESTGFTVRNQPEQVSGMTGIRSMEKGMDR